jgi:hypothetical protein
MMNGHELRKAGSGPERIGHIGVTSTDVGGKLLKVRPTR